MEYTFHPPTFIPKLQDQTSFLMNLHKSTFCDNRAHLNNLIQHCTVTCTEMKLKKLVCHFSLDVPFWCIVLASTRTFPWFSQLTTSWQYCVLANYGRSFVISSDIQPCLYCHYPSFPPPTQSAQAPQCARGIGLTYTFRPGIHCFSSFLKVFTPYQWLW